MIKRLQFNNLAIWPLFVSFSVNAIYHLIKIATRRNFIHVYDNEPDKATRDPQHVES